MENKTTELYQKSGMWYFRGEPLRTGTQLMINDIEWNVLGVGRSRNDHETVFIWIRNERFGTSVYVPSPEGCLTAA